MGVFKSYTAAERRRMDKDQQDPRWLAWLANMDERLRGPAAEASAHIEMQLQLRICHDA